MSIALIQLARGSRFTIYAMEEVAETAGPGQGGEPARNCPVLDFVRANETKEWAKMQKRLDYTAANGPSWNEQQCRKLSAEIYEFKTSDGLRLLWFYEKNQMIICTSGYMKKKQKADPREITRAEEWKAKYERAKAAGKISYVAA